MDRSDTLVSKAEDDDHLSVVEFEAAYAGLSPGDRVRLRRLAHYFACRCGGEADDLLQEALKRILEGRRHCPRAIPVLQSIAGIISSLASEASESYKKGLRPVAVAETVIDRAEYEGPSPEREVMSQFDDGAMLGRIQACVDGDEECQMLLEGICDGMRGSELEELLDVDTKGLATIQRRLQRKIGHLKAERASR